MCNCIERTQTHLKPRVEHHDPRSEIKKIEHYYSNLLNELINPRTVKGKTPIYPAQMLVVNGYSNEIVTAFLCIEITLGSNYVTLRPEI